MSENEKKGGPVILAVDDSEDMLALVAKALGEEYRVMTAADPGSAIEKAFGEPRPDLILLDIDMPDIDGFEVCRALKDEPATSAIPVIFLTGRSEAQSQVEGLALGAVDYISKTGTNATILKSRVGMHLALRQPAGAELERLVQERTAQLERTRAELIKRLARVLEVHESQAVGNRVMRLANYVKLIAQASGALPDMAEMMQKAAPLHDIGKLGVPAEILRKREKLSAPDWERIKRHPEIGAEIIGEHDRSAAQARAPARAHAPRELRRHRLSEGPQGRGDPLGRARDGDRRRVRGHDQHPVPPRRAAHRARDRRNRARRRHEIRPEAGRGVQEGAAGRCRRCARPTPTSSAI